MGKTESEAIQLTREKLLPTFISLIPLADDDVLVDFTRLLVSQYRALNNADSTQCYGYASGKSKIDATLIFARQLVDLELKIQERAINTARRRDKIEPLQLENLQAKLQTRLLARGVSVKQLELLDLESVPKSRHKEYCEIAIALFEEVTKFPQSDAANFMRSALTQ